MTAVERAAEVLAAHRQASLRGQDAVIRQGCTCEWISPRVIGAFTIHQAEALAAAGLLRDEDES